MQNKDQKKKRILKTILTNFSDKKNAITRYTKIYIKTKCQGQHKTSKKLYFQVKSRRDVYKQILRTYCL